MAESKLGPTEDEAGTPRGRPQYRDSTNLRARASLHARFSTNEVDWVRWVFERLDLQPESRVLELGCGTGQLWRRNLQDLPRGCEVVLSDLSPGMASEARDLLAPDRRFTACVCDAQLLPFPEASFDQVVANHMLYHVPDRKRALREMWRVLKTGGRLMAATNGRSHMRELFRMLDRVTPGAKNRPFPVENSFSLQNGAGQLREWLADVSMIPRDDSLEVTEAGPVVAYALSTDRYDLSGDGETWSPGTAGSLSPKRRGCSWRGSSGSAAGSLQGIRSHREADPDGDPAWGRPGDCRSYRSTTSRRVSLAHSFTGPTVPSPTCGWSDRQGGTLPMVRDRRAVHRVGQGSCVPYTPVYLHLHPVT